jgi:hypothetical protein
VVAVVVAVVALLLLMMLLLLLSSSLLLLLLLLLLVMRTIMTNVLVLLLRHYLSVHGPPGSHMPGTGSFVAGMTKSRAIRTASSSRSSPAPSASVL